MSSLRRPALLLAFLLLAPALSAQILMAHPRNQRAEKKFREHLVTIRGERVVLFEIKEGLEFRRETGELRRTGAPEEAVEGWISDSADPRRLPYKPGKGGERKVANRKQVLKFWSEDISGFSIFHPSETWETLAREYELRLARIQELEEERDAHRKGDPAWFAAHNRLLRSWERLEEWLRQNGYLRAANKTALTVKKEKKAVAREAVAARLQSALDSIRPVDPPPRLLEVASELGTSNWTFKVMESRHVRLIYVDRLSDEEAHRLLEFAEQVIEGFRNDFVDPYLGEDYEDRIPETVFHEFCFGPASKSFHEKFCTAWYGMKYGDRVDEALASKGNTMPPREDCRFIEYWRFERDNDMEGILANRLGHSLATLHYGITWQGLPLDFVTEGCGMYLSLEHLGRNTVTNLQAKPEDLEYEDTRDRGDAGALATRISHREFLNRLALQQGKPLDALARLELWQFEDADLAQSWSLFDWLARKKAKDGQLWLRDAGRLASDPEKFLPAWRKASEERFGVQGTDVFRVLLEEWREYARSEQDLSDQARKRRR